MGEVKLGELRERFRGSPFAELVQHHLNRQSQVERIRGLLGTIAMLPEQVRPVTEEFIDQWNGRIYDPDFWQRDTAEVFDEIVQHAREVLLAFGLSSDDSAAFNLFNIVVLNYAYSAYDQPAMREFMGIKAVRVPWPSLVALLYPISAAVYAAGWEQAGVVEVAAYGLSNLGYLLFGAGVISGSFRVLGLKKRWQVLSAAVVFFLIGTALSNVHA